MSSVDIEAYYTEHFDDCPYCTGEDCALCLLPRTDGTVCEHDHFDRHGGFEDPVRCAALPA